MTLKEAKAIFAGAGGVLVTLYLWQNPALLQEVSSRLVWQFIAIVLALLAALRAVFRKR